MIVDWVIALFASAAEGVLGQLPDGAPLAIPGLDAVWNTIGGLDAIVPIIGPLQAALGLLAAGIVFVIVRLVLTVWNLIYP